MKPCSLLLAVLLISTQYAIAAPWKFVDVTQQAGFNYQHGMIDPIKNNLKSRILHMTGGVAAGDYDGDGWVDLYVVRGDIGPNLLFRNKGNGTFEERSVKAGLVSEKGAVSSGPTFADFTGDGLLDLFVGGAGKTTPQLFRNRGNGTFENMTPEYGISDIENSYSAAFGDYDRDGDLDLYVSHWSFSNNFDRNYLFANEGQGEFKDASVSAGLIHLIFADFTGNFADVNDDGWPDLLVAADFEHTKLFLNNQDGTFRDATDMKVITDENGMGAAIGDYDNDGDLDWFVTSILDARKIYAEEMYKSEKDTYRVGKSGNRLYRNRGDGSFEDVTELAGVRDGGWGWGSCFADFNNDGNLDLFHVNGFLLDEAERDSESSIFVDDPVRMFISNGDGTFTEQSAALGLDDTSQGRGVSCFDYDRDGDIDIFIANFDAPPRLYRNDGGNRQHYLGVSLKGDPPNTEAIGARIYLTANGITQTRELRVGSNFESQNPVDAHFGLGDAKIVNKLRVVWPNGKISIWHNVSVDQVINITTNSNSQSVPNAP